MPESKQMAKKKLISTPESYPGLNKLGIVSPLREYKLAFLINRIAGLDLIRTDDLPVYSEKTGKVISYPFFTFYELNQRVHYYLIGNNHTGGKMCPDIRQADFLLLMHTPHETAPSDELFNFVKSIEGVQLVIRVGQTQIKNLEGIMSDIELHMVGK